MEVKPGYKQTEVGVVPEVWEVKTLGELAPLKRGFDLPTSQIKDGLFPVVYSNGIMNHHHVSMASGPGVVTGRSGTLGKVHYVESDYWPHNTSLWVTRFNGDPRFIFYLYTRIGFQRFASGSGVPTLNRNDAHAYCTAVPASLPEQRAIATALGDVDALLAALDRLIAKKRDLKQAAMQQLLTGKTRLPGFKGEWEEMFLGDLFNFKNGLNKGKEFFGYGTPIVNYMDVFGNAGILCSQLKGRVSLTNQELTNFDVKRGDVLFTRTSETPEEIGMASVILDEPEQTVFSGFVLRGRPKNDMLCDAFKAYCFRSSFVRRQITSKASYTTRALTNGRILSAVLLLVPPLPEQNAIAAVLSDMDAELTALEQRREKTRALKQGMMQELLTGRTRLV